MSLKSYTELQAELSTILERFEHSVHQDVDELLKDYEAGIKLIKSLEAYLGEAEIKVKKIKTKK